MVQSRLNMWFISNDLIQITKEAKIEDLLMDTDHNAVTEKLKGDKVQKEVLVYTMRNTEILEETEYETVIKQAIEYMRQNNG